MKRILSFLLLVLIFSTLSFADGFVPVVTNYSSLDYEGGLQNWAIDQGENGEIYIGNSRGVLCFDGYNWSLTPLPGNAIARSLLVDGNRLYVGSYENFGYFTRDAFGRLHFTSLWNLVRHYTPHHDEIWNIIKTRDGKILFQSFTSWFEYDGHTVKVHYSSHRLPLYFFNVFGKIYSQLINGPFCEVVNGRYVPVLSRTVFHGDNVVAALPLHRGRMLLCTEFNGLFTYNGHHISSFRTEIDSKLKMAQVNRAIMIPHDSTFVIGTIIGGIYGLDSKGNLKWHYDTHSLLRDNSVLRLFCDRDHNVWAALDVGVALIHSGAPYALFTDPTSSLGMVYDIYRLPDRMYIATNQCTYLYRGGSLYSIHGTEGQNWLITSIGNQLIVGNNHGTKYIHDRSASLVPGSTDAGGTSIRRYSTVDSDYLIESSYSVFQVYKEQNHGWCFRNRIRGFNAPVRQFEIDGQSVIWAANMNIGLYRIELSSDLKKVSSVKYFPSLDGSKRPCRIYVMKIRGEIVLSDGKKLYMVGKSGIVSCKALSDLACGNIVSSTPVDNNRFWLVSDKGYTLIQYKNSQYHRVVYVPAAFFGLECGDYINNVRVMGGRAYFCLNGGVGCMDLRTPLIERKHSEKLLLCRAENVTSDRKIRLLPIDGSNPSISGDVSIQLSYPNYNNEQLKFVYSLSGGGRKLYSVSSKPNVTYSSLHYGRYHFQAAVVDVNGRLLGRVTYTFHYPRPLFLSIPAFIFYFFLFCFFLVWFIRWRTDRIVHRRARKMEAEKMRQDLKMAEQEQIIESQKQQLLEQQLQDKGRKIASMAMDAVMHKQQVSDIQQELKDHVPLGLSSGHEIERMLRHVTDHIDSDEYWNIYRENFDLIHKKFFRNLRERYPALTTTDLKFCALLRLNLSTKDIAHFAGLTIRGVEGARYRLRRKLQIPGGQSLTEFLIDLK